MQKIEIQIKYLTLRIWEAEFCLSVPRIAGINGYKIILF